MRLRCEPNKFHPKGSTKQFGCVAGLGNQSFFSFNHFRKPCNHPNLYAAVEIPRFEKVAPKHSGTPDIASYVLRNALLRFVAGLEEPSPVSEPSWFQSRVSRPAALYCRALRIP
jgi:hypothetical protein